MLDPRRPRSASTAEWLEPTRQDGGSGSPRKYNVARMLERDDFKNRLRGGQPIAIHEFLYPLAQATTRSSLHADVELGGTDQLFNLNVGREIMPDYGLAPQIVMTTPLLEGLDGIEKMSKSLGNYVGIDEPPGEIFGKLMSISDELMWRYYLLLTDLTPVEISARQRAVESGEAFHPKRAKSDLAKMIVRDFHDAQGAEQAAEDFERRSRGDVPVDLAERPMLAGTTIEHLLLECGLAKSGSEATRKVQQGAVRINGEKFTAVRTIVDREGTFLLQVGRQMFHRRRHRERCVCHDDPKPVGRGWIIMQNKGQVDIVHSSRESAIARAREVAQASRSRLFVFENERLVEDAQHA